MYFECSSEVTKLKKADLEKDIFIDNAWYSFNRC